MDHELVSDSFSIIHRHPCIETQNLGKDQALAYVAALICITKNNFTIEVILMITYV